MKSKIGWSRNDGNTDKDEPTLKDIVKSLCKIKKTNTKYQKSIRKTRKHTKNVKWYWK